MSETPFPVPRTPQFIPSSWDDEFAYLSQNFITYPTPQPNVVFPVAPTATTLPVGTSTTQVATTAFVQNAIAGFLSATINWIATQTFSNLVITAPFSLSYLPSAIGATNIGYTQTTTIATNLSVGTTDTSLGTITLGIGRWLVMSNVNTNGGAATNQITHNLKNGATVLSTSYDFLPGTGNWSSSQSTIIVDVSSGTTTITATAKISGSGVSTVDGGFIRANRMG